MVSKEEKTIEKQKTKIKRLRDELRELRRETKRTMNSLITSAFGFVAALFWRDAIQALLDQTFGINPGEGFWLVQMVIAVIVTIMAVIVIFSVSKTLGK
jgi:hypothetical protein